MRFKQAGSKLARRYTILPQRPVRSPLGSLAVGRVHERGSPLRVLLTVCVRCDDRADLPFNSDVGVAIDAEECGTARLLLLRFLLLLFLDQLWLQSR